MTRQRRGLTLLEVLVGVVILVLGVLPSIGLFSQEERESRLVAQKLMAATHLRERADQIQSRVITERFEVAAFEEGPVMRTLGEGAGSITVQERVQFWRCDQTPGLFQLRVEARWQDKVGGLTGWREHVVMRLIADPEHRGGGPGPLMAKLP